MPVKFYLDAHPNKIGEFPVRMSISLCKKRFMTTIGHYVDPAVWDGNKVTKLKYANSRGETSKEINSDIFKLQSYFTDLETKIEKVPTSAQFKDHFKIALGQKMPRTKKEPKAHQILVDLNTFIIQEGSAKQWAEATYRCWKTFSHHLTTFNPKVQYEDFNEQGINDFIYFLRVHQNLEEKTAQKQYSCLKWFLNWAIRMDYCKEASINKFKPKFKIVDKPIIFLTKEELLKLYSYKIPAGGTVVTLKDMNGKPYEKTVQEAGALAKTRDLFCFCCFTSLRYSDMAKVKWSDIEGNILHVTTQKTNDTIDINLNKYALEILDNYKDITLGTGHALPVISNQKMNHYLKDLCELCEFNTPITKNFYRAGKRVEETYPKWELIGTHAGRRTFICFALSQGIPPQVVMKWTGHSDYKAMRPYIDIAEKVKSEAMSIFEKGLE